MSTSVTEFVEGVEGVRGGVAEAIGQQFDTVAALSEADTDTLTAVRGVGPVLAERILDAARTAVIADHTPAEEPTPDATTRARASVAQAKAASRPSLEVVEGEARGVTAEPEPAPVAASASDHDTSLPPLVERVATLVGRTIGWSLRIVRNVTQPVHHLLRRG